MRLSLPRRWFLGLAGLLVVLLVTVNIALRFALPGYLRQQFDENLRRHVLLLEPAYAARLQTGDGSIHDLAHDIGQRTGLRVTVMDATGVVIGESGKPVAALPEIENHLQRPEIQQSLRVAVGYDTRTSATVKRPLRYAAIAVRDGDHLLGFVRVAMSLEEITETVTHVERTIALASLLVALASLPLIDRVARRVTVPISAMQQMAAQVAAGDFRRRAPIAGGPELEELGAALNEMSRQLETRLRELALEKAELQATLANMIEGVLVVDATGKIRLANDALQRMFGVNEHILGRTVIEVFRNAPLADLVAQALAGGQPTAAELPFLGADERVFDINAAPLRGQDGAPGGLVVVFHDITRIKKLENTRKDFVANVSHELRTPLSIIKGYVETLLEEPPPDPPTAQQFLGTIQKHTRRLETLIGDLLTISALESQHSKLTRTPVRLAALVENVRQELGPAARAREIAILAELPDDLPPVRGESGRLQQVLVNLLDNAIKYTQVGGQTRITARVEGDHVEVCVADNGPGIAREHLDRIFERFYRVDKARSREVGGTGLGLSIVKHIIQAHGGRVWAESELEHGSRFYVTLPRATAAGEML